MAMIDFGGVKEKVVTRNEFPLARARQVLKHEVIAIITRVQIREEQDVQALESARRVEHDVRYEHPAVGAPAAGEPEPDAAAPRPQPVVRETPKVGRNAPCPCGSGKKYKHCHGQLA